VVYSVGSFGDFLELALPATNFVHQREKAEKKAFELIEKLGLRKEDAVPTDLITLQYAAVAQQGKR
jgi:adenylate cyclase class IV